MTHLFIIDWLRRLHFNILLKTLYIISLDSHIIDSKNYFIHNNINQLINDQIHIFGHLSIKWNNISIFLHLFCIFSVSIIKWSIIKHIFYVSNRDFCFHGQIQIFNCWLTKQTNILVFSFSFVVYSHSSVERFMWKHILYKSNHCCLV